MDPLNKPEIEDEVEDLADDEDLMDDVDTDDEDLGDDDLDAEDADDDSEEDGDDDGQESDGDWTPPSREEWEAMQAEQATMKELLGDNFENILKGEEAEDIAPIPSDELRAALTPKTFSITPELRNKILVDGDGDALVEFSSSLIDTVQHNMRIEMNKAVLNGIDYAMPIIGATAKFYEKHPELMGMRKLVKDTMNGARAAMPSANELQLLRAVEKRLGGVIETAKKIYKQHGGKPAKPGNQRNLAPKSPAGSAPSGRQRTAGVPKQNEPTAASRLRELQAYAEENRY